MAEEAAAKGPVANYCFDYKNIRHVESPLNKDGSVRWDSEDQFKAAIMMKYQKIDSGEYQKQGRPDPKTDLKTNPALMEENIAALVKERESPEEAKNATLRAELAELRAEMADMRVPSEVKPVATTPSDWGTEREKILKARMKDPEMEAEPQNASVIGKLPEKAGNAGMLEARPRKGGVWYDVFDETGNKVNKTPVRKKEALAFVEESNRGKVTDAQTGQRKAEIVTEEKENG